MTQVARIFMEEAEQARQQGMQQGLQQGLQQGMQQGIQQGRQQGIQGTVRVLRSLGYGNKDVEAALKEQYDLSEEEMKEYLL